MALLSEKEFMKFGSGSFIVAQRLGTLSLAIGDRASLSQITSCIPDGHRLQSISKFYDSLPLASATDYREITNGFNMKTLFRFTIASVLSLHLSSAHSAAGEKDVTLTCAAYYYSLSLYAPKLVEDLTADQAVKASFAFRKQLDGALHSHKSDDAFIGKWMELSEEIAKPANKEVISAFRGKYESTCRPLLQKAWCDAYKEFSKVGCAD